MKFNHYIFDLDGTIVNTKEIHQEAFNQALIELCLPTIESFNLHLYEAKPSYVKIDIYNKFYNKVMIEDVASFLKQKNEISLKLIQESDNLYCDEIWNIFNELYLSGSKMSICSNCTLQSIKEILITANIYKFIDNDNIFHNKICRPKPNPQMYKLAMSKSGIPSENSIIFEDGAVGLRAALSSDEKVTVVRVASPKELIKLFS
jgi:beta-phosphoglucomutase-like phosphatase (HAD superfamily)